MGKEIDKEKLLNWWKERSKKISRVGWEEFSWGASFNTCSDEHRSIAKACKGLIMKIKKGDFDKINKS